MLVRTRKKKALFKQLAWLFIPSALTLLLVWVSIFNINQTIEAKHRKFFDALSYEIQMLLENTLLEAETIAHSFTADPSFFLNLQNILREEQISYENLLLLRAYERSLNISVKTRPYIDSLYCIPVLSSANQPIISTEEGIVSLDRFHDRSFILDVLESYTPHRPYVSRSTNINLENVKANNILTKIQKVMTTDSKKTIGGLFLNLNTQFIEKKIAKLSESATKNWYAITLYDEHIIWASQDILNNPHILNKPVLANEQWYKVENIKLDNIKVGFVKRIDFMNAFSLYLFIPKRTLVVSDYRLSISTIFIILFAIAIGIVVIVMFKRKKQEDVALFADYLEALDNQSTFAPEPAPLVNFDDMNPEVIKEFMLKDYISLHISQRELKERKLELDMLRKQLNPHFLLNIMQMLNWKIIQELNGYGDLNTIVEDLTKILSYSLHANSFFTTFIEEKQYTKSYVALMNRVTKINPIVTWQIPEEMKQYCLPRQILQPLIENSYKYGFNDNNISKIPEIKISAISVQDKLIIQVSDNGVGISSEKLKEIHSSLENETLSEGIGLANTNRRIKLLFGKKYGLKVKSLTGQGLVIEIQIPQIIREEQ